MTPTRGWGVQSGLLLYQSLQLFDLSSSSRSSFSLPGLSIAREMQAICFCTQLHFYPSS